MIGREGKHGMFTADLPTAVSFALSFDRILPSPTLPLFPHLTQSLLREVIIPWILLLLPPPFLPSVVCLFPLLPAPTTRQPWQTSSQLK